MPVRASERTHRRAGPAEPGGAVSGAGGAVAGSGGAAAAGAGAGGEAAPAPVGGPQPTDPAAVRRSTAAAYDEFAVRYSEFARDALDALPLDRALLGAFAESVRSSSAAGPVVDAGCGPGWTTAHLHSLGVDVLGVDLSPTMIGLARHHHPGLSFEVGSMDALDLADGGSAGVLSWYSVIHLPPPLVPSALAEFRRVLADGGVLLLAFFESEGGPVTDFDHAVTTAYRWPIEELAALASDAGFAEVGRLLREPVEGERFRRGHLLMRA